VRKFLLAIALFLLMGVPVTMNAAVVGGGEMGFGKDIDGVGAAVVMGTQDYIANDSSTVIRTLFTKVNFGPSNLDNVGAVLIHYWPLDLVWKGLKIGQRVAADYEIDDSEVGLAAGLELAKTAYGQDLSVYFRSDIVKRSDISYFVVGVGIILFK